MQQDQASDWRRTAGIVALTLGTLGFVASTCVGGGIIAGLLNPLFFIGVPLGVYWLRRAQHPANPAAAVTFPSAIASAPGPAVKPLVHPPVEFPQERPLANFPRPEPKATTERSTAWVVALLVVGLTGFGLGLVVMSVATTGNYNAHSVAGIDNSKAEDQPTNASNLTETAKLTERPQRIATERAKKEETVLEVAVRKRALDQLPRQLAATHAALAGKVDFTTRGQRPRQVVERIAGSLRIRLTLAGDAAPALDAAYPVRDELMGLAHGTVLTTVIAPAGLVMIPVDGGGLRISIRTEAEQWWPVGWPIPDHMSPHQVVPGLDRVRPLEIGNELLGGPLGTIGQRLGVPLVIDYEALARRGIDLDETYVSVPKTTTFYTTIDGQGDVLDYLLSHASLKWELRLDEAQQPFLWITERQEN